ncbi:hypothetical protein GF407_07340 [candidate division KSB1 bacterium]|nr:hypothetical protein [candidate division KSB1 bacterium]
MKRVILFLLLLSLLGHATAQTDSTRQIVKVDALVYADSAQSAVSVRFLQITYKFAGYGLYIPENYPVVQEFSLVNGQIVGFSNVSRAYLKGVRVKWKKYVQPQNRHLYSNIDEQGYRHWSDIEVNVRLIDWDGNTIKSRLERPESSDVFLTGKTDQGAFSLQLDQENNKTVMIKFKPRFVMRCTRNETHIFPNKNWKFCPICGAPLQRIGILDD